MPLQWAGFGPTGPGSIARTRIARLRGVLVAVRWGVVRYVAIYDRTAYATPRRLAAALRLLR
jgi:hypothetical protein